MLTFECCLQQLLGLCIKTLDFILLSTRLPHDHPAPAALYWGGVSDSTWGGGEAKEKASDVERGAGVPSAWDRYSWAVLGIWWLAGCPPNLASGGDWAPAKHLLLSLGTPVASGIT